MSFMGVLSIRQGQSLEFLSMPRSSFCKEGTLIRSTRSMGFLSSLSLASLLAPRISRDRTGLVLLKVSTLLTASGRGFSHWGLCQFVSGAHFTTSQRRQQFQFWAINWHPFLAVVIIKECTLRRAPREYIYLAASRQK